MSTAQYGRLYDAFQQPRDEDRVTAREACTLFRFAVLVTSLFLIWKAAFQPAQVNQSISGSSPFGPPPPHLLHSLREDNFGALRI